MPSKNEKIAVGLATRVACWEVEGDLPIGTNIRSFCHYCTGIFSWYQQSSSPAILLALVIFLELPISSQQSIQGAMLGTMLVAQGFDYLPLWNKVIGNYVDVNILTATITVAGSGLIGTPLSLVVVVPLAMKRFATNKNYRNSNENTSMKHECVESQGTQGQSSGAKVDDVQPVSQCSANTSADQSTPFKQLLKSTLNRGTGGLIAAMRFLLCGWRLTQFLGGKLTYMSNSRGWASQLSTVAAMITVARVKPPVSSVHAFVGSFSRCWNSR
ncbi:hypothetical protein CRYUN_Cryun34aG0039100 [Craigia yunnanensis]